MRPSIRALLTTALTGLACLVAVAPASATPDCFDPAIPLNVEEQRLDRPVPREILRVTGYDQFAPVLRTALCVTGSRQQAETLVTMQGRMLWTVSVDRAQGRRPAPGLDRTDDRPLYWARLDLSRALRQWVPAFPLTDADRAALLARFERTSRGQDTVSYPTPGANRVLVSGFDPFTLDADIRISNPSGANALALDGVTLQTSAGPARVETAMFPVNWDPFAAGVVEQTFLPRLRPGSGQVDMFATVSQGRFGQFDLERFNGRWRGGFGDNLNVSRTGVIPIPPGVPTVLPAPEFVPTTLPFAQIIATPTGPFPVFDNTGVVEIPAGSSTPVFQPGGPTPGSVARQGGGGDYLSNEISYRTTLLRDAVRANLPGGHVHTPVLTFGPGNTTQITDPTFVQNRIDIITQTRAIITAAAGTLS